MDIREATVEQIAIFKSAAAARYAERGVPAKLADQAFNAKMAEVQNYLMQSAPNPKAVKIAEAVMDIAAKLRK